MHTRVVALALSLFLLEAAPSNAAPPDLGWTRYTNARFGSSAELPLNMFQAQPPSANGDGRAYRSKDGADIRIFGSYGPLSVADSFEDYKGVLLRELEAEGIRVTYKGGGAGWFAYSGLKGSTVVYYKVIEGCGAAHTVQAEYPQALKTTYDPIVSRVVRSLRCRKP